MRYVLNVVGLGRIYKMDKHYSYKNLLAWAKHAEGSSFLLYVYCTIIFKDLGHENNHLFSYAYGG